MSNSYLGQSPVFGDFPFQILSGDGTAVYTLNFKTSGTNGVLVFLNGAVQRPGIDFSVVGDQLTFQANVSSGVQIFVYGMGLPKSSLAPSAGSVGDTELSASLKLNRISQPFSKLRLSSTGTDDLVSVTANHIALLDDSFNQKVVQNVNLSISISSSGVNGLDTGVSAASTWYSVWVIWNGTTVSGLLSLSSTSPTMPVGYTHKARVGWIRSDNTANKYPLRFSQAGERVGFNTLAGTNVAANIVLASGVQGTVNGAGINVPVDAFIPPTACAIDVILSTQTGVGGVVQVGKGGNLLTNVLLSLTNQNSAGLVSILLDGSSRNIAYASNLNAGVLFLSGWRDSL